MLPRMWRIDACMNMLVNTVSQVGIVPAACPGPQPSPIAWGTSGPPPPRGAGRPTAPPLPDRADALGHRPGPGALLLHVLIRVIRAADQGTGRDVGEAELIRRALERLELVRMPVADDRKVLEGRPQVLADRQNLDVV